MSCRQHDQAVERSLLLGALAVQIGLVDQLEVRSALEDLQDSQREAGGLGEILVARGVIDEPERQLLEDILQGQVDRHGSIANALASLSTHQHSMLATIQGLRGLQVFSDVAFQDAQRPADSPTKDEMLDRFKILRPFAHGGRGEVVVAEDGELHREVAVKRLLRAYKDDPDSRRRLIHEAETTGRLEHPGIVPVYGFGKSPDGEPFYAMQFIRGETLKQVVANSMAAANLEAIRSGSTSNSLALRKLLRSFLDVCDAVGYAHSQGVIHRDIKPDNIVIGPHGETLLVDWGLAKETFHEPTGECGAQAGNRGADVAASNTIAGSVMGTPAFMSPEQARGEVADIGPASDQFSLGATLFFILTGQPATRHRDLPTILADLRAGSVRAPRAVNSKIDRGLDAICRTAMDPNPENRYPSVAALAGDIERWLADEPVSVYREPWSRKLARWRRRNRNLVTALGIGLLAAVAFLTLALALLDRERRRTRKQYARAETEFQRARTAVDEFFTQVSETELFDAPGLQPLRQQLLESARSYYQQFLEERGDDKSLKADLAKTRLRLGLIAEMLEDHQQAIDWLVSADELYQELQEVESNWRVHNDWAFSLNRLGDLYRDRSGQLDRAIAMHHRSQALYDELVQRNPDEAVLRNKRAGNLLSLAQDLMLEGSSAKALELAREGVSERQTLHEIWPTDAVLLLDFATAESIMAVLWYQTGHLQESLQSNDHAAALYERLSQQQPHSLDTLDGFSLVLSNLGRLNFELGDIQAARDTLQQALANYQELSRSNPEVGKYQQGLAATHNMLSDVERAGGRLDEAGSHAEAACALLERLIAENPDSERYQRDLAKAFNVVGRVAASRGQQVDAQAAFARSVGLLDGLENQSAADLYNLACNEALQMPLLNDRERNVRLTSALNALRQAANAGLDSIEYYRQDADFEPLRNSAQFQAFLEELEQRR